MIHFVTIIKFVTHTIKKKSCGVKQKNLQKPLATFTAARGFIIKSNDYYFK